MKTIVKVLNNKNKDMNQVLKYEKGNLNMKNMTMI